MIAPTRIYREDASSPLLPKYKTNFSQCSSIFSMNSGTISSKLAMYFYSAQSRHNAGLHASCAGHSWKVPGIFSRHPHAVLHLGHVSDFIASKPPSRNFMKSREVNGISVQGRCRHCINHRESRRCHIFVAIDDRGFSNIHAGSELNRVLASFSYCFPQASALALIPEPHRCKPQPAGCGSRTFSVRPLLS